MSVSCLVQRRAEPVKLKCVRLTLSTRNSGNVRCYRKDYDDALTFKRAVITICSDLNRWIDVPVQCEFGCMEEKLTDLEGKPVYRAACVNSGKTFSVGGVIGPYKSSKDRSIIPGYPNGSMLA